MTDTTATLDTVPPVPPSGAPHGRRAASASPGADADRIDPRRLAAFLAMVFGMFMAILDIQIVSASSGPGDPAFFDRNADTPQPFPDEMMRAETLKAMTKTDIAPLTPTPAGIIAV